MLAADHPRNQPQGIRYRVAQKLVPPKLLQTLLHTVHCVNQHSKENEHAGKQSTGGVLSALITPMEWAVSAHCACASLNTDSVAEPTDARPCEAGEHQ